MSTHHSAPIPQQIMHYAGFRYLREATGCLGSPPGGRRRLTSPFRCGGASRHRNLVDQPMSMKSVERRNGDRSFACVTRFSAAKSRSAVGAGDSQKLKILGQENAALDSLRRSFLECTDPALAKREPSIAFDLLPVHFSPEVLLVNL